MGKDLRFPPALTKAVRRRGVAMLEMAFVLPILLLLLVGILEMGRVVMISQIATNATREAARRAIIPGATDSTVLGICNNYLDRGGISATGRSVQVLNGGGSSSSLDSIQSHEPVTIRVSIPFSENTWGFAQIMGGRSFTSSVTMRRE
jgi:Flp pilus assembly protein TadG